MTTMTITAETVRLYRERKEREAREIAATIPPGDYYADGERVKRRDGEIVATVDTHIQAVRVMMAIANV